MKNNGFVLRGNILYTPETNTLLEQSQGYLVCVDDKVVGVYAELPQEYAELPLTDYGDKLIIPGLVDLHVHAPQYAFRGLGMDLELLPWLQTYTFPEESKYQDLTYASRAYAKFVKDLVDSATTRATVFGTMHREGTMMLMEMLDKAGLGAYVGKVNMDRNSIEELEETTDSSLAETEAWLAQANSYANVKPILTPRFIPSCSDELMEGLATIRKEHQLPVQSHLSENKSECAWVKELHPDVDVYADAYVKYGMLDDRTIMAHCVFSEGKELDLLEKSGAYVAHCPDSNANLSSGIAPIRTMLDRGIKVGLGSDVAGGARLSLFTVMADAIQHSKLRWVYVDENAAPLTATEAFYLATKGGGSYFGQVGSFEPGYEFDAVILDDANFETLDDYNSLPQRLERAIYLADDRNVVAKYVSGKQVK